MVASWMIYSLIVGALLVVAASLAERVLRMVRLPVRGVWAAAMLLAVTVPLLTALRQIPVTELEATAVGAIESLTLTLEADPISAGLPSLPAFPALDVPLLAAWALLSLTLLAALLHGVGVLQGRRREWQRTEVDGREVLVANGLGPAVIGWKKMEIVLPAWALTLDREARRLILAHEEEHIRRRDPGLLFAGLLSALLLPWNAALWYLYRRLRLAIELDCDARVVATGADLARYGEVLLEAGARTQGGRLPALATFAERATQLENRITALTAAPVRRRGPKALAVAALAATVLVAACTLENPLGIDLTDAEQPVRLRMDSSPTQDATTAGITMVARRMVERRFPGALAAGGVPDQTIVFVILDSERQLMSMSLHLTAEREGPTPALAELPADQIESIDVIKGRALGLENVGVIVATVKPGTMFRKQPSSPSEEIRVGPDRSFEETPRLRVRTPATLEREVPVGAKRVSPQVVGENPAVLMRRPATEERVAPAVLRRQPPPR